MAITVAAIDSSAINLLVASYPAYIASCLPRQVKRLLDPTRYCTSGLVC